MGKALQYINIAQYVVIDAQNGRCYLSTTLLKAIGMALERTIALRGQSPAVTKVHQDILKIAMEIYEKNVDVIEGLPVEARGGVRVAVEAYVETGRVMIRTESGVVDAYNVAGRKATVPSWRRILIAWIGMVGYGMGRRR